MKEPKQESGSLQKIYRKTKNRFHIEIRYGSHESTLGSVEPQRGSRLETVL
jgi:hypothetical protein